jgi:hypothetical protein
MKHVKQLVQMPQVNSRDAASLRQLINYVSSYTNALKALNKQVFLHDLMLNHLMLSVLDIETHKEWELHSAKDQDIPCVLRRTNSPSSTNFASGDVQPW